MNDITVERLREKTRSFLDKHWSTQALGAPLPLWDGLWRFEGTVPNHDKPGCYALLAGESVLYIGVGARRGAGRYEGMGLGARLTHVWKTKGGQQSGVYEPEKKWAQHGVDAVVTTALPQDRAYLAYALEAYLIDRLRPPLNMVHPGATRALGDGAG